MLKTYLDPVVGQNEGTMKRSHGLRYCEWRRTQIIFLFNDNWTTSASYLRVRSTGQSRFRFWNPDFVGPWIFYLQFFRHIRGKIFKELLSRTAAVLHPHRSPAHIISIAPESGKILLVESGILVFEIRNPTNDWSPESQFHLDKDYIHFFGIDMPQNNCSRICHWFLFVQLSRRFVTHHAIDYSVPGAYS